MITARSLALISLFFAFHCSAAAHGHGATPARPTKAILPLRIRPILYMAIYDAIHHPDNYPSRTPRTLDLPLAPGSARVLLKISAGGPDPDAAIAAARSKASAARTYLIRLGIDANAVRPGRPVVAWYDFEKHKWSGYWATLFVAVIVPNFVDWPLFYDEVAKFGDINPGHSVIRTRHTR